MPPRYVARNTQAKQKVPAGPRSRLLRDLQILQDDRCSWQIMAIPKLSRMLYSFTIPQRPRGEVQPLRSMRLELEALRLFLSRCDAANPCLRTCLATITLLSSRRLSQEVN